MVEVIWTKLALNQLERAIKYIKSEEGTFYAKLVLNKNSRIHFRPQNISKAWTG